ncbi:MAG: LysR family transcriptional regulator [Roseibium sp.]|uniref:LysR family transcriptional regulator n=1 Tax=Roseibium sp. TaxID=1936156 RepID=UPI002611AEEF|nr:LysR family transcriptional regulator [Roseibium sp.]MCV0424929.1 LysR family transcriptional regulator [Roseibium sp.]
MKPQHVELIVTIAELGSLGAAAARMNRTQPAITKALKAAEADLGTPIFFRASYGVVPTSEGQLIVDRCRKIFGDIKKLQEEVAQIQGDYVGTIDIIVSPLVALKVVPTVLRRFQQRFPNVKIGITGGHAPAAFSPLRRGEADFVLGPSPSPSDLPGLHATPLFSTPVSILTGAQSRYLNIKDPLELKDGRWIMIGPKERRPVYYQIFESKGISPPEPFARSDSVLSILSMLEGTDLLCSFPSLPIPEIRSKWDIGIVPIEEQLPTVSIAITSAKDRILTPAAFAFSELVQEHCKDWN